MTTDKIIELTIISVSSLCAVISVIYAYKMTLISKQSSELSYKAFEENRNERKLNLHYQFQTTIRELQKQLPATVNDKNYNPTIEEKRIISLYWYCIFDEWYICKKQSEFYSDLWDKIYVKGLDSAFKIDAFKNRIEEMFEKGESSFMGFGMEFKSVLNEICFTATKTQLK
ncbi:MAG: hypothetical protein EAZ53_04160 [Bacteroidetes bacterium]|nr:MAG: hypothetical protein EAZ53_04160 [Bacteroidota bacterium]